MHGLRSCLPMGMLSALLLAGCARIQPPPGLAKDSEPPRVHVRSPEPGARDLSGRVAFQLEFSEYVDRATLRSALSLNPRPEGELELDWRGRRLRVRPSLPLAPNRTWTLEIGTGLQDLAGNHAVNPLRVPFATGGVLDTLSLELQVEELGRDGLSQVWLWPLAEAPQRAYGRAPWRSSPDAQGRVRFEGLPAGRWLALAVEDRDRDGWWNSQSERAGLPSRVLSAPDSLARQPVLLRLSDRLWTDSLSLEGGQFVDRERVEFRAWLEPTILADWVDSLRHGPAADSLRLGLLQLLRADGSAVNLAGLAPSGAGWRLFLTDPADSLAHVLRFKDGRDSLLLRPPAGPLTDPLVDLRALAQAWANGRLTLACTQAVELEATRAFQVVERDTLAVPLRRLAADLAELRPLRAGGRIFLEKGLLRHGARQWPDTLLELAVPLLPAPKATGGLQWSWNRRLHEVGWRLVIRTTAGEQECTAGVEQVLDRLPVGPARFALYQDRDGSGAWSPGRLQGLIPAEPWIALPDTVEILPGWVQGGIVFQVPEWIP
jgi:hypothetical protein